MLLAVVLVFSKSSYGQKPAAAKDPCEGVECDLSWTSIMVTVKNAFGQPVQLDEAYTTLSKTGQRLPQEQQKNSPGQYILLDDAYRKQLENEVMEFTFIGMKKGAKVVEETYQVSADCCHVKKVRGKDVVVMK
jgi:hypothetical protein